MNIQQLEKSSADANVSAPNIRQRNAKIDSLTGLRFIAACLVFMYHIPPSADLPVFVRSFLGSGHNGVTLFFTLSGFVLCYNYYDAFSKRFVPTLKSFFVARFARIYPLHFLLFLLFFFALPILPQFQHFQPLLAQITLTQAWSSDPNVLNSYNEVAWSVSVEAFLYLCFPLLVLLLLKRATKIRHLCLIGFAAFSAIFLLATWLGISSLILSPTYNMNGVAHQLQTWVALSHLPLVSSALVYGFPLPRLGDFILGCVAARIYVINMSKPISPREQVLGVTTLLLSIAAVLLVMEGPKAIYPYKLDSGFSLFFACIIYTLARYVTPISRFLSTKLLVLLGEASYAFYLLHYLLLTHALRGPSLSTDLNGDLFTLMEFLFIVIVSLGAYTYVETPIRKKIRQLFAPRASVPASGSPVPTVRLQSDPTVDGILTISEPSVPTVRPLRRPPRLIVLE